MGAGGSACVNWSYGLAGKSYSKGSAWRLTYMGEVWERYARVN